MKDWNEALLDKELEALMEEIPEQDTLEKKIEEGIQRKIRKTVVRTVSTIAAGLIALFLIINPLMNAMYLNPYKLNEGESSTLLCVLRDYWETMQPYAEIISVDVEKKGFSRYELAMQVANHRERLNIGIPNVWCEMSFGKYSDWKDTNEALSQMLGRFSQTWMEKEEYIAQISELPQSSVVYLSIGAPEARKVEDLQKENVDLEWIQVYQPNVEFQGGINMRMIAGVQEADVRDEMTAEELKAVYISNLENLLENTNIWKQFGLYSGNTVYMQEEKLLTETYEDAKSLEILESKNYCISGKRDEIVDYLEKTEILSIGVDDVRLSSLR